MKKTILIVGAGFAGSIIARQLAEANHSISIIDKRNHIGGNAYDSNDSEGVLVHNYGPHIFHTNSERIFNYLSQFTKWRPYEHRVRCVVDGQQYPFPINQDTVNQLYNLQLNENQTHTFFEQVREPRSEIKTSEDVVINSVGRDLYEKFFLNYTKKQWGLDPSELKAGVAARIPVRTNKDDRYFTDTYQAMPLHGYTNMFQSMLNHPNIIVLTGVEFSNIKMQHQSDHIIFTGPIDEYFNYCLGRLPYRSLRFEHEHFPNIELLQSVGTINYPNEHDYTRITEFKHLTGQKHSGTSTVKEYPLAEGDPYYPIPNNANEALFKKYEQLAKNEHNVTFVGRLAQYRYYNMDQVVGAALITAEDLIERFKS